MQRSVVGASRRRGPTYLTPPIPVPPVSGMHATTLLPPPPPIRITGSPLVPTEVLRADGRLVTPLPCFDSPVAPTPAAADGDVEIAAPRIDGSGRIQLTELLRQFAVTTGLSGRIHSRALLLDTDPDGDPRAVIPCPVDRAGRLSLPAPVRTLLGVEVGDRVLVVALPDAGRMIIQAATVARAALATGMVA